MSQLGSFDGYGRRLLNPTATVDSSAQAQADALHAYGGTSEPLAEDGADAVDRYNVQST